MGNCFCNNDPYRQYVLRSDVYVNNTIDNINSNFTTAKLVDFEKLNSQTKKRIKSKSSRKTNESVPPSLVSTESFIQYKSKKSNGLYNDNVRKMNKREILFKEQTDRNSIAESIKENKTHNGENFEQKKEEKAYITEEVNLKSNVMSNFNENNEDKVLLEENKNEFSKEEEKELTNILISHFMFRHFDIIHIKEMTQMIKFKSIDKNEQIFTKGDEANEFYIIKSGTVRIIDEDAVKIFKAFSTFGEISLSSSSIKRQFSAIADSDCKVYVLDKVDYFAIKEKNSNNYEEIYENCFNNFFLLNFISEEEKKSLIEIGCVDSYHKNGKQVLWNANSSNKKFLYVSKGRIRISNKINNNLNEIYGEGSFYGLNAIFPNTVTSNSINTNCTISTCADETEIILIYEKMLMEIFGLNYLEILSKKCFCDVIKNDFFLSKLVENCKIDEKLYSKLFFLKFYSKNEIVFNKGLYANRKAFFILSGSISYIKSSTVMAKKGDFFRNDLLITSYEFEDDVVASENTLVYETNFSQLISVLSNNNIKISYLNLIYSLMNIFPLFSKMELKEILNVARHIKSKTYHKSEIIVQQNSQINFLYLIADGTVKLTKNNKKIKIIDKSSFFGDYNILSDEPSSYNYVAKSNEVIVYLIKSDFFNELLYYNNDIKESIKNKTLLEENTISLNDLYYLSYLGRGRFGNVCLVHNELCFYAIKTISKSFAEKQKFGVKYLLLEKKTLRSLDHPFVLKLVKTLKNENWLFFLMEQIKGINMHEYLNSRKIKKNLYETKFYAACLFLAITYLHSKRIVHRDIKPANLMIDSKGYVKVIDFGTAKKLKKDEKTKTVIGTPNFIAPEVLKGKGYSYSCDFWSIGICIYYIFYGSLPFGNNSIEIMDTYNEILEKEVSFPEKNNNEINSLVSSLLEKNENKRNCDFRSIKNHLLFSDFNWDELIQYKVKPPYVPGKDWRHNEENLQNINIPFVTFIDNEKCDTKQTVTLKYNSPKKTGTNSKNFTFDTKIPKNWYEDF